MRDCFTLLISRGGRGGKEGRGKKKKSPPFSVFQRVLVKLRGSLAGEAFERSGSNERGRASKKRDSGDALKRERSVTAKRKRVRRFRRSLPPQGPCRLRASAAGCRPPPRGARPVPGATGLAALAHLGTPLTLTAMSQEVPPHPLLPSRFWYWGVSLPPEGVCAVSKCPGSACGMRAASPLPCRLHPHQHCLPIPACIGAWGATRSPLAVRIGPGSHPEARGEGEM